MMRLQGKYVLGKEIKTVTLRNVNMTLLCTLALLMTCLIITDQYTEMTALIDMAINGNDAKFEKAKRHICK